MKAKLYNIELEGTPEEIAKFKELMDAQFAKNISDKQQWYPFTSAPANPLFFTQITCDTSSRIDAHNLIDHISSQIKKLGVTQ